MSSGSADQTADALLQRELVGYLRDAVVTLPDRLRKVVVDYFFEERPMREIASELGVTESRVSQMRAEAIDRLRAGMEAVLEPLTDAEVVRPTRRSARRSAAYASKIAAASTYKVRLSATSPSVHERIAAAS